MTGGDLHAPAHDLHDHLHGITREQVFELYMLFSFHVQMGHIKVITVCQAGTHRARIAGARKHKKSADICTMSHYVEHAVINSFFHVQMIRAASARLAAGRCTAVDDARKRRLIIHPRAAAAKGMPNGSSSKIIRAAGQNPCAGRGS